MEKTKSTHFCGEFQNGFFRIKEKSCVDIAASYRKTGVFTFLQTKNTHFYGENKKYAFLRRKQKVRIFAEKTKSTHFCGEKKYALSWRKQKVRIFVENFPNKNGYFCLEDRISYDRKRKGEKRCGNGQKRHFIVRTKPTVQWFTGFVCFT